MIAQEKMICEIAKNGSCVIVGRAADYVLREYDNVLRVFIYAPKEYRVNKIMGIYGHTKEEAISKIKRSDEARAAYYRNISGEKWGEPRNYNLCIDSSVGVEASAECIYRYVGFYKLKNNCQ